MNESFNIKRFISLFVWSTNINNIILRIFVMIFAFVQLGWLKSKADFNSIELMNLFVAGSLIGTNFMIYQIIIKRGIANFILLPATVIEKFLYASTTVFCGSFIYSFVVFPLVELSSRMLFSVSKEWFAFDSDFAVWMVFTTSILFFIQFLFLKRSNAMAWAIVSSVIIFTANIFIDNYFIEHFAQHTSIRLLLYTLLSVGFIGAAYLQFLKCEATIKTKNFVLK
jgi:hypothetical protein